MAYKSILIAIIITSSSMAGCLEENSEDTSKNIADLSQNNEVLLSEITILESQIESLNTNIGELNDELSFLQLMVDSLNINNSIKNQTISQLNLEIDSLYSQKEILELSISTLENEKNELEANLSIRFQEGYDTGYGDAYDASYDGIAQHYYNEGWDDGWEIANNDAQQNILEMQEIASNLNDTIISLEEFVNELQQLASNLNGSIIDIQNELNDRENQLNESIIGCGVLTTLSDRLCVSDSVVWGRLPFEQGTNLTIHQAFMGGWTHQEKWLYSVDFGLDEGTPVVSFKPGIIREIKEDSNTNCIDEGISQENCTHGNYVLIDHGDFTFALYLHLKQWSVEVEVGEMVGRGHQIGLVGNTGYSTDPHLHFTVKNGFGDGNSKMILFEELAGVSNGIPFSGLEVVSNNSNISSITTIEPSNCPSDIFLYRGVIISSEIPCSMAEHDLEYNLSGYAISPGMDIQVAQYVQYANETSEWIYDCIDTNVNGNFSTILEWESNVYGDWSYLMISVTPDDICYAYDGWWTSIGITMI